MTNKQITEYLLNTKKLISNSINDQSILNKVSPYGYDTEKLTEGQNLLNEADEKSKNQNIQYAEQYEATQRLHNLLESFDKTYGLHREIARALFEGEPGAWEMLHLTGRRRTALSDWLKKARHFYGNIKNNESLLNRMSELGFTTEYLDTRLTELDEIENAMMQQARESGEAQQATVDRDKKIDELEDWVNLYKSVAKLALADQPQLLEKLGLLVRSN